MITQNIELEVLIAKYNRALATYDNLEATFYLNRSQIFNKNITKSNRMIIKDMIIQLKIINLYSKKITQTYSSKELKEYLKIEEIKKLKKHPIKIIDKHHIN